MSHDKVTRFLSERLYTGKDLWLRVKPGITTPLLYSNRRLLAPSSTSRRLYDFRP